MAISDPGRSEMTLPFVTGPAEKLILEWIDRELADFIQGHEFRRRGAAFSKAVPNGTAVIEIVGWPASTGRRASVSLLSGIESSRLSGSRVQAIPGVAERSVGWYSTHVWWSPGAVAWDRGGRRWRLDQFDAETLLTTGVEMRRWLDRSGWQLIDRFSDDREVLAALLDDDSEAALNPRQLRWTRTLVKVFGPATYLPKLDGLLEAVDRERLQKWSSSMRHAERLRAELPGAHVTSTTGTEIGFGMRAKRRSGR